MDKKEIKKIYKQMPPDMGLYQVKNLASGKVYIGRALDLNGRINSERFQLKNGLHMNRELQADFNALGEGEFSFEILDRLPVKKDPGYDHGGDLQILEEMWLEKLQPYAERGYHRRRP